MGNVIFLIPPMMLSYINFYKIICIYIINQFWFGILKFIIDYMFRKGKRVRFHLHFTPIFWTKYWAQLAKNPKITNFTEKKSESIYYKKKVQSDSHKLKAMEIIAGTTATTMATQSITPKGLKFDPPFSLLHSQSYAPIRTSLQHSIISRKPRITTRSIADDTTSSEFTFFFFLLSTFSFFFLVPMSCLMKCYTEEIGICNSWKYKKKVENVWYVVAILCHLKLIASFNSIVG